MNPNKYIYTGIIVRMSIIRMKYKKFEIRNPKRPNFVIFETWYQWIGNENLWLFNKYFMIKLINDTIISKIRYKNGRKI